MKAEMIAEYDWLEPDAGEVLRPLSQGGFGSTYLVKEPDGRRKVAKVFSYSGLGEDGMRLFIQEPQLLKKLNGIPGIPKLYSKGETQKFFYQEYIRGENLKDTLSYKEGMFSEEEVWKLLGHLLETLKEVHKRKIIHRDIKPSNIILRESDGRPFLIDFGVSKLQLETQLNTATSVGSAEYAAPEQVIGKANYCSDIYGLGLTAIYLLTGVSPINLYSNATYKHEWESYCEISFYLKNLLNKMIAPPRERPKDGTEALEHWKRLYQDKCFKEENQTDTSNDLFLLDKLVNTKEEKKEGLTGTQIVGLCLGWAAFMPLLASLIIAGIDIVITPRSAVIEEKLQLQDKQIKEDRLFKDAKESERIKKPNEEDPAIDIQERATPKGSDEHNVTRILTGGLAEAYVRRFPGLPHQVITALIIATDVAIILAVCYFTLGNWFACAYDSINEDRSGRMTKYNVSFALIIMLISLCDLSYNEASILLSEEHRQTENSAYLVPSDF